MELNNAILEVRNLNTSFITDSGQIRIVKNVSFRLQRGTTLALVGESGCGKTVTVNSVVKLMPKNAVVQSDGVKYYSLNNGEVNVNHLDKMEPFDKQIRSLRGTEISMIFQDPMASLNPVYRVGWQVAEGLIEHSKIGKKLSRQKVLDLFKKLGIPDPERRIDDYPHQFSGGMKQRVIIAIAMICDSKLIIADEPTTALDVTIQAQIMNLLKNLQENDGKSIILITHNMGLVAEMADEVCIMYMGRIVESGSVEDIFDAPLHPYTQALLRSVPVLGISKEKELETIAGVTPDPATIGPGCEFANRCSQFQSSCSIAEIANYEVSPGHHVRCLNYSTYPEGRY